jgi:AraC-like DNA-binding protein
VQPSRDVADFLERPLSHYIAGPSFVVWAHSATLIGCSCCGCPDEADFPLLLELRALSRHPSVQSDHHAVLDCRQLQVISPGCFEFVCGQLCQVENPLSGMRRLAVLRPGGVVGAAVEGLFHRFVKPEQPGAVFSDLRQALRWLGRADEGDACAVVEDMLEQVRSVPPLLRALHEHLRRHLRWAPLADAALALGHSPRSLQRRLKALGTSYRVEINRTRVRVAQNLLTSTDTKLEVIALQVGCSSPSQLSTLFRAATGERPSAFRSRRGR